MDIIYRVNTVDPSEAPDFIGQEWYNTVSRRVWKAIGIASVDDWVALNTGEDTRIFNESTNTYQPIHLFGAEETAQLKPGPSS